ncbi:unnamed protein product, partial [Vitis vinifera]
MSFLFPTFLPEPLDMMVRGCWWRVKVVRKEKRVILVYVCPEALFNFCLFCSHSHVSHPPIRIWFTRFP